MANYFHIFHIVQQPTRNHFLVLINSKKQNPVSPKSEPKQNMFAINYANSHPIGSKKESNIIDLEPRVTSMMLSNSDEMFTTKSCSPHESRSLWMHTTLPNSLPRCIDKTHTDKPNLHLHNGTQSQAKNTLDIISELIEDLKGLPTSSYHSRPDECLSSPVRQSVCDNAIRHASRKRTFEQTSESPSNLLDDSRDFSSINDLDSIISFDMDTFESSPQEESSEWDLISEPCALEGSSDVVNVVVSMNNDEPQLFTRPTKRQRSDKSHSDSAKDRFHGYQSDQWLTRYEELCAYCSKVGHCNVPSVFKENPTLARWVKRQRYQYKLMKEGKPSTMTNGRAVALEGLGFIWDSQSAQWAERPNELKEFRRLHGHCIVPSRYSTNSKLAIWVKIQRRQYKLLCLGKKSNMTMERVSELEKINFAWEVRSTCQQSRKF